MFWVIQNNLYNEYGYKALMDTIVKYGLPHTVVKPIPCRGFKFKEKMLVPGDFDSFAFNGEEKDLPEPIIDESGLVVVMGSITLDKIARKRGWVPGSFSNENFHYVKWKKAYGENLLNYESHVCKFIEVQPWWDEFFIRPCEDSKAFNGEVYTYIKFDSWRERVLAIENDMWLLNGNTEVVVSPIKEIYNENRFFIVDGEIITYSQYRLGDRVLHNKVINSDIVDFTKKMVDLWQPSRAYSIDTALTPEGPKVIEIGCFNSSGFYACNVPKIIEAVESMKF